MISAVVLSAGLSSRFGSPKALAPINNTPAVNFLLEKLTAVKLAEIIVVLGADSERIEQCLFKHKTIRVVHNKHYKFGQTSSVQTGLQTISSLTSGFMLFPVDCPFISEQTIESMAGYFRAAGLNKILIPTVQGRRGHPPVFDIYYKDPILKMDHAQGLNSFLKDQSLAIETVEFDDPGITQSFNTPEEFAAIKKTIQIS